MTTKHELAPIPSDQLADVVGGTDGDMPPNDLLPWGVPVPPPQPPNWPRFTNIDL